MSNSNTGTHYEFRAIVRKVEERFARSYDAKKLGEANVESQAEYTTTSTGWWVLLEGWPVAMRFGNLKPLVKEGDTMCIVMHVITLVGANAPAAT
jgi:hypothetical protein